MFGTTAATEYTNLTALQLLPMPTTQYGKAAEAIYASQVARLGLILTQAMNHGVALMNCPSTMPTWQCWNLQTNWYPTATSATYPDITQNLYARFLHTATNSSSTPFFVQPLNPVKSAGKVHMGMAYGFSNDELPTPPVPSAPNPEVPSKMDQTVVYGGAGPYTITFGPWQPPMPSSGGGGGGV